MIEFLIKFKNRGIKIARVNTILITISINLQLFTLILYAVGVRCDRKWFSVLIPLMEKCTGCVVSTCPPVYFYCRRVAQMQCLFVLISEANKFHS